MANTSAAWALAILAILTGLIGTLMLTVTDPVMQFLFDSALWSSSTSYGTNALTWQKDIWTYWPVFILFGIMSMVWIRTRRPS